MNVKREVIVSQILAPEILRELELLGYKHMFAKPSQTLTTELRYHPDILGFRLPDGKWISEADGIVLTDAYPGDCIFNCVSIGKTLIYGNSFIAQKFGCMFDYMLKVRQSYVKCSCIVLDDKAMITSDPSIYRALNGTFDVLKTSNENIFLNGFSCGFIGGASGVVDNTILFCGDIRKHKDYNNIKAFANNRGFDLYSLSNNDLYDYGGILPV